MSTTMTSFAETITDTYQRLDFEALRPLYADDAIVDVHVPLWRFQHQGPDNIVDWLTAAVSGMPSPRRVTFTRTTETADGAVVEWELRVGTGDGEMLCREVDVFHTAGGKIVDHAIWCTGMWDPATIARQKAEAPMVRW